MGIEFFSSSGDKKSKETKIKAVDIINPSAVCPTCGKKLFTIEELEVIKRWKNLEGIINE